MARTTKSPKAKPVAFDFSGERAFISHVEGGKSTLYGPFASRAEAIVCAAATFADDDFLALHLGIRSDFTKKVEPSPWGIQTYDANELNWLQTYPEEMGYQSCQILSAERLPLTGVWPLIFSRDSAYTAETVASLLAAMPKDAGERGTPSYVWMLDAGRSTGLLPSA